MSAPSIYQVDIVIPPATVTALINGGYYLYVLHATQMTDGAARPTIWSATQSISANTQVIWPDAVSAYTSPASIVIGKPISIGFDTAIKGGQTLDVAAGGNGTVMIGGPPTEITFNNTTTTPFTVGFAIENASSTNIPTFAVPLYGGQSNQAFPSPQVLLSFSTKVYAPGTVITSIQPNSLALAAYTPALLVDLNGVDQRQVNFDINSGWSWGSFAWAQTVSANADLSTVLIQ